MSPSSIRARRGRRARACSNRRCCSRDGEPTGSDARAAARRSSASVPAPRPHGAGVEHHAVPSVRSGRPAQPRVRARRDAVIAGASGKLQDVESIAIAPDGRLGVATRAGILLIDDKGAIIASGGGHRAAADSTSTTAGRLIIVREVDPGARDRKGHGAAWRSPRRRPAGPKLLQDISAGAPAVDGRMLVADREARVVSRFRPAGQSLGGVRLRPHHAHGRRRSDEVAMLDTRLARASSWSDRTGKMLSKIPQRGTGYEMKRRPMSPSTCSSNVYVLDRDAVLVFAPGGKLLTIFTPDAESAFERAGARARQRGAALHL